MDQQRQLQEIVFEYFKEMAHTVIDNGVIEQEFCEPIKMSDRKLTIPQMMFAKQM